MTAYETTLRALPLVDRSDPIARLVARKVLEVGPKLVDSVHGLMAANLDGRGHDDIARLLPVLGGAYESQVS